MAILLRNGTEKWKTLETKEYSNEQQLQVMLHESPELIPLQSDEDVAVFVREAGLPGSGSTDLLGVDSQGNILIVETKLARNQEARRKVVGQILEYAAFLWRMSFDDFDNLFIRRREKSVLALLVEQSPEVDAEGVRETIKQNLQAGKFQLLIAVDQINHELQRIIAYLAESGSALRLEALELELYVDGSTQVLVPKRHGTKDSGAPASTRARLLTIPEILERVSGQARSRWEEMVRLWSETQNRIEPGTVGASFKAEIGERLHPIFWAYPTTLQPAFGSLAKRGAPPEAIQEFRNMVATFAAFDREKVMNGSEPMAQLSSLSADEMRRFVEAAKKVVGKWREAVGVS